MVSPFRKALFALANLLATAAILIFATGFFPYKAVLPGLATYESLRQYEALPSAPFDKVVFMVVDALRSDFVFSEGSGFQFTQSLISSGYAIPFTAHATSPTITMPRVKAITTGSVPSFLDVILNFAESDETSTLAAQDTWLAQLKARPGGKLVMYGDDTWLRLFPGFFERADGTTSFFVSDFTEVDNNVTRHVPDELGNADWSAMIMHYLGLDHIGHKTGPLGPNMIPKQIEMDGIVKKIYHAIETEDHLEDALLVLIGDHGMNEGGNHGGSAPGETSPALVFMSPKLRDISKGFKSPITPKGEYEYYRKVEQSDIAPTLAGLLGFPVPRNNLGVFIDEFLTFWPNSDRVQILHRNAKQIQNVVKATFSAEKFDEGFYNLDCSDPSSEEIELACKWRQMNNFIATSNDVNQTIETIKDFCKAAQEIMSSTASNYDMTRLVGGIVLTALASGCILATMVPKFSPLSVSGILITIQLLLYGVMMFASSFVEEEQHIWYWGASAWLFYLAADSLRNGGGSLSFIVLSPSNLCLLVLRIARRYNQTGQKYAGAPDIVHSLVFTTPAVLWALVGGSYLLLTISLITHFNPSVESNGTKTKELSGERLWFGTSAAVAIGFQATLFKLAFTANDAPELLPSFPGAFRLWLTQTSLVLNARLVFITLALSAFWFIFTLRRKPTINQHSASPLSRSLHTLLTIFLLTQSRTSNIPLFALFSLSYTLLSLVPLTPLQVSITTLLMTHVSFFALGNSNAISSIDLSNAYNGVAGYNVLAVGLLVFAGNWAGPIWWGVAGVQLLKEATNEKSKRRETGGNRTPKSKPGKEVRPWVQAEREALAKAAEPDAGSTGSGMAVGGKRDTRFFDHAALMTLFTTTSLLAVMVACTMLRTHLFIWTVFSPKYLYSMAWGTLWHLGINLGLGYVFWNT